MQRRWVWTPRCEARNVRKPSPRRTTPTCIGSRKRRWEFGYDYASQDPVNGYDLTGEMDIENAGAMGCCALDGEGPGAGPNTGGGGDFPEGSWDEPKNLKPKGLTTGQWRRRLWGRGAKGAQERMGRTVAQWRGAGLTADKALKLRNFYLRAIQEGKGGPAAYARAELMDEAYRVLKGGSH